MSYSVPAKTLLFGAILLLTLPVSTFAQSHFVGLLSNPSLSINSSSTQQVEINFMIKQGYHIQADTVKDDNLVPCSITFEKLEGVSTKVVYPKYKEFFMNGADETLLVFDNNFNVKVEIVTSNSIKPGSYVLPGELYYQACDSERCLFPRTLDFEIGITVPKN